MILKMTPVDIGFIKLDKKVYGRSIRYLEEFYRMNVKSVKLTGWENDYKNVYSMVGTINKTATRHDYPIKAMIINKEPYLIRKDLD